MRFLNNIKNPDDLKRIDLSDCGELASEIREFLIKNVLVTGGHLASNLGVVELTVALHRVFDVPRDKIIFDVGHQAYVHKMLTGRLNEFSTLRQLDGLSGFPKPRESKYDCFGAGHASTSISAALGMARARDILGEKYNVIAFLGDGAMTGGMTFEALNDVGSRKTKLIIVLNDNEMSIEKNVGGLSAYLGQLRCTAKYQKAKDVLQDVLDKQGKTGEFVAKFLKETKDRIKFATIAAPYFEALGIKYIGIVDGHNTERLTDIFQKAKQSDGPVIIHTLTKKGLGYPEAEISPEKYHGVSCSYDLKGTSAGVNKNDNVSYSDISGNIICKNAEKDKKIVAITAAMASGCGLSDFARKYPNRFFDVGIAEEHAVTMAAGMAATGIKPVVFIYSTFLQRAYDQILHDVCIQNLNVVFAIDRAGVVGSDGETHQGVFDISYLSHIPNVTLLSPSCKDELEQMFDYALNKAQGPVFIRYPKHTASMRVCTPFNAGKCEIIQQYANSRIAIISEGIMTDTAVKAAETLKNEYGLLADVINIRTVKPFDKDAIYNAIKEKEYVFTLENNAASGGMGSLILLMANSDGISTNNVEVLGFPDEFIQHGTQQEIFEKYNLDELSVAKRIYERIIK